MSSTLSRPSGFFPRRSFLLTQVQDQRLQQDELQVEKIPRADPQPPGPASLRHQPTPKNRQKSHQVQLIHQGNINEQRL